MRVTLPTLEFHLPFAGHWFVAQAGDSPNVNHHMRGRAQWDGIDFMKTGGPGQRALSKSTGLSVEDFFSWSEPVLSPAEGIVEAVANGFPDNPLGKKDAQNSAGNNVVIKAAPDRYVFIAHLRKDSIHVKRGDHIAARQELGACGNSGHSDYPHIHMHVQNRPRLNDGEGQNMVFQNICVELTGKVFENVSWTLISGLFVGHGQGAEGTRG